MPTSPLAFVLWAAVAAAVPGHPAVHHPYARPHRLHRPASRVLTVPQAAAKPPAAAAAAADDVEDVETVEPVATPAADAAVGAGGKDGGDHVLGVAPDAAAKVASVAGFAALLGHLHAALVHLPIAWVLLWLGTELGGLALSSATLGRCSLGLAVVTTASFAPAVLTGLCRFDELASGTKGYETGEALLHRNLIYCAAALCALALVVRLIHARWPNVVCRVLSFVCVAGAAAVTGFSAHLGGRMVYGADFLPF